MDGIFQVQALPAILEDLGGGGVAEWRRPGSFCSSYLTPFCAAFSKCPPETTSETPTVMLPLQADGKTKTKG